MNWISLGRRGKGWKVGKVLAGMGDGGILAEGESEVEGEADVLASGEAGMSDIVGTHASESTDGGRSDHVSVLVAAIAIDSCFLLFSNESSIRSTFFTNSRK